MIENICCNCKHAHRTNCYYEEIDGGLEPLDVFVAYCPNLDCYVLEDDFCNNWESGIKTIKVTYK